MVLATSDTPLISLIVLCYKHERYIAEAIEGILAQNYAPLDIIFIDDCSPDRTADLIEQRLAQRTDQSNVRFIRNPKNLSGSVAMQIGLKAAKGSFIVFTCGDDVMLPEMVEEMAKTWLEGDVSLVTTNATYIDDNSQPLGRTFRDPHTCADESFETLARDGANAVCFGAAMGFERALYETFGWPPTEFLGASDIVLPFYAYLLKGARFINKPLLKYRVHSNNTSLSLLADKTEGKVQLLAVQKSLDNHLAHAVFFYEELDRLRSESPVRYTDTANKIMPLANIQITEVAKKLIRNRRALHALDRPPKPAL